MSFAVKFIFIFLSLFMVSNAYCEDNKSQAIKNSEANTKKKLFPGTWSSSLDYMYFSFEGTRPANGNLYDFEDIQLDLQMFTLKYDVTPLLSYSLVAAYQTNYAETYFFEASNDLFRDRTHGISDTLIKRTQVFVLPKQQLFILDIGLYLPTGSINEKNQNNTAFNYPYNMQLGSGTFDPMVSAIYLKTLGVKNQLGALGLARLRTGENNRNQYHLGNDWTASVWYAYLLNPFITPSLKLNYRSIEGVSGVDPLIGRPRALEFYYRTRAVWDLTPSVAFKLPINKRLSVQALAALPVWQRFSNIDDVEVETNWYAQLGVTIK